MTSPHLHDAIDCTATHRSRYAATVQTTQPMLRTTMADGRLDVCTAVGLEKRTIKSPVMTKLLIAVFVGETPGKSECMLLEWLNSCFTDTEVLPELGYMDLLSDIRSRFVEHSGLTDLLVGHAARVATAVGASEVLPEQSTSGKRSWNAPTRFRGRGLDAASAEQQNAERVDAQDGVLNMLRERQRNVFRPGEPWLDDSGVLIQAHGGGVLFHEGTYFWFGEHKGGATYVKYSEAYSPPRVDVIGVGCYSSKDLLHWKNEGLALRAKSHPDLDPANVLERPKVLYHRQLQKFVMWLHVDTSDYEWARVGVAVADRVTGPYTYIHSFRPHNQQSRDMTVFQDEDGSAFIAYSSEDNAVMHVARLTPDFLGVEPEYRRILVLLKREAPAMFKFGRYYLLLTSGCTGWAPNRAEIYYATDVMGGEWRSLGNPSAGGTSMDRAYTFFSQPTFVVPVVGKAGAFVFMADQWNTENLGASRYVWLPMWIEEIPADALAEALASWQKGKELHMSRGGSSFYSPPPGPLHIVIEWLDAWPPALLSTALKARIRDEHWHELRTYPLEDLDIQGP